MELLSITKLSVNDSGSGADPFCKARAISVLSFESSPLFDMRRWRRNGGSEVRSHSIFNAVITLPCSLQVELHQRTTSPRQQNVFEAFCRGKLLLLSKMQRMQGPSLSIHAAQAQRLSHGQKIESFWAMGIPLIVFQDQMYKIRAILERCCVQGAWNRVIIAVTGDDRRVGHIQHFQPRQPLLLQTSGEAREELAWNPLRLHVNTLHFLPMRSDKDVVNTVIDCRLRAL